MGEPKLPHCYVTNAFLEAHHQRKLQRARIGRAVLERSAGNRSILFDVAAGCTKVYVVEHIEEICPELYGRDFLDREVLLDRQVRIENVRTKDAVSTNGPDLVKGGGGKSRASRLSL